MKDIKNIIKNIIKNFVRKLFHKNGESNDNHKGLNSGNAFDIVFPIVAVILSLIIGMFIIKAAGKSPIQAYRALFLGAFGDLNAVGNTLSRATPLIFTGLGVAIAFKCGLFNIGVEGQLLVGAMAAAIIGHYVTFLPGPLHLIVTVIGAIIAGSLWGLVPGLLKAYRGVHEVLISIMMNYIGVSLISFVVEKLRQTGVPRTPDILKSAEFARFSDMFDVAFGESTVSVGFILAVIASILIYILIEKTVLGYELRAVGTSPLAAENGGIKISKNILLVMIISGALAGLAGADRVLGEYHALISGVSAGLGFEGMAVALLVNNNPIGIIFSGILFGALASGGLNMSLLAGVPQEIVSMIQAIIIFFIAGNKIIKQIVNSRKKEVKA